LRAWFAAHDTDWRTFIENWEQYAFAPERSLPAWHGSAALRLCRAKTGEELVRFTQGSLVVALGCANGQVIFLKVAV